MPFGKDIKRLREKSDLSASKIAGILGVKVERFRQWEARDRDPKDERDIAAIEKKFGMPLSKISQLETLPDLVKTPATIDSEEGINILIKNLIELKAGQRVILSILAEVQAPTMQEKTLPTQLLSIYRKMVKDEAVQVGEEIGSELNVK